MKYEDFAEQVKNSIAEYMGDAAEVKEMVVLKNNAVRLHGISVLPQEGNVSPTIYLDDFFKEYEKGKAFHDIVAEIIGRYEKSKPSTTVNIDFFTDYSKVRKRVLCKLVSYDKNVELLEDIPHVRYLDLAIVFYCMILHDEIGPATILVNNGHMEMWSVTAEELYQAAEQNTRKLLGFQIKGIEDIMTEMLIQSLQEELEQVYDDEYPSDEDIAEFAACMLHSASGLDGKVPMYVLSNREKMNGAACLLYRDVLSDFADELNQDLFIIPSSIHEVILVPTQESVGYERLTQMVQEVNATQVEADEILADHVYYFSRDQREVFSM